MADLRREREARRGAPEPDCSSSKKARAEIPRGADVIDLGSDDEQPPPRPAAADDATTSAGDSWICWRGEPLIDWLQKHAPSRVRRPTSWISLSREDGSSADGTFVLAAYMPALNKLSVEIQHGRTVSRAMKDAAMESIKCTAREQQYVSGKWMLRLYPKDADAVWPLIARAVAAGELGDSAKIGPTMDMHETETTVCCVYVSNFDDRADVRRVLVALRRLVVPLGLEATLTGFKPNAFTMIESKSNKKMKATWRLAPTIYKVVDVLQDGWLAGGP